jgi:ankyrin repeat protein
VKAADNDGWTALHAAAENGLEEVVKLLLDHGAAENGHEEVVKLLLDRGAEVDAG